MKRNIIIAFRNLKKNLTFSIVNISGLTVGLTCFILLALWIQHELSFDSFYKKSDRLYIAYSRDNRAGDIDCWSQTSSLMAPALKADYPEVQATTRFNAHNNMLVKWKNQALVLSGAAADPGFLTMFEFPLSAGSVQNALNDPHSIIVTEATAEKLFGKQDVLNEVITLDNNETVKVTGVIKKLPDNTLFDDFDFLLPFSHYATNGQEKGFAYWGNFSFSTFVELKPGASLAAFNNKVKSIVSVKSNREEDVETFLYPLSQYRLNGNFENGHPAGGRIQIVTLFGVVAGLILLIACINFMNLSTARSEKRAREVGVRKAIGAGRFQLIKQFLGESMLITAIAFALAVVLAWLLLPAFNKLTEKQLFINFNNPYAWAGALLLIAVTGLIAGSYPSFYLSAFNAIKVLKGSLQAGKSSATPRKILVVFQFSFSITLIIAVIVVYQQIEHARNRPAGYNRNNVVYTSFNINTTKNYEAIRNELLASGTASYVTATSNAITRSTNSSWGLEWTGKPADAKIVFDVMNTDEDFAETFGLTLTQGRSISRKNYRSDTVACMLNETAVKITGFKQPLGQVIEKDGVSWKVVGVFKDFILGSPFTPIKPMFIMSSDYKEGVISMRLNNHKSTAANIAALTAIFKKYDHEYPFEYRFVDDSYNAKFRAERLTGTLSKLFGGLTIFIACLGLFGLAAFSAEQKEKEIGIRKVLGASVNNIILLLSQEFVWLIGIALAIASPLAWLSMNQWLNSYSYRITISGWVFVFAGLIIVTIALLTISIQAVKAALVNPVKSLRNA